MLADDQQRTWFLLLPFVSGAPGPARVCRLAGAELTCGIVPNTSVPPDDTRPPVRLLEPVDTDTPLLLVQRGTDAHVVEPFTWRTIRVLPQADLAPAMDHGLAWRDAVMILDIRGQLWVAPPGSPLEQQRGFGGTGFKVLNISRWGAVLLDHDDPERILMTAPFVDHALGPTRELARGQSPVVSCREGDTFGYVDLHTHRLVRLDLASGARQEGPIVEGRRMECRPGSVAAITANPYSGLSALCDQRGCGSHFTHPDLEGTNYRQVALVDGNLMLVATLMGQSRVVTRRIGEPARVLHIADNKRLVYTQLASIPSGAIALFRGGELLVFDHRGGLVPVTLRWVGEPRSRVR